VSHTVAVCAPSSSSVNCWAGIGTSVSGGRSRTVRTVRPDAREHRFEATPAIGLGDHSKRGLWGGAGCEREIGPARRDEHPEPVRAGALDDELALEVPPATGPLHDAAQRAGSASEPLTGDSHAALLEPAAAFAASLGFEVAYERTPSGVGGWCDHQRRGIVIDADARPTRNCGS
jgi:hypothetical protein